MKILMIAPQPFFEPRGTPISVYQRLQALSALGYEVDLLTYHVGADVDIPGVRIHRIPNIPFIKHVKIGPSWAKLLLDIIMFWKALVMLLVNRYHVIHSHEEAAFLSVILASMFRTYHFYDMHSSLPRQLNNFNFGNYRPVVKLFEILERWVINTADAVITVGVDLAEQVREINPAVKQFMVENLPIHPNGKGKAYPSKDELKARLRLDNKLPVVYTGTFESYQGLDLLFESAKIVRQHTPEVAFILVGGKPHQVRYWQNEVRQNNLEDCTVFVGSVSPEEALTYLEVAEILVSPRTEGLSVPLKIYTYLYSGKPTVATKLFAHTQILNENIAILVEPEKEAFAEGILSLIRNPELRRHLGLQAQAFVEENYNPATYSEKLEQIYQADQSATPTLESPPSSSKELPPHLAKEKLG